MLISWQTGGIQVNWNCTAYKQKHKARSTLNTLSMVNPDKLELHNPVVDGFFYTIKIL